MDIVMLHLNYILVSPCDFYSVSSELTRLKGSSQMMQYAY